MIIAYLMVVGLALGSFVNALVWRIYSKPKAKRLKLKPEELSILHGRSMCVHCKHQLAWYDLLPVISWLMLRGKCRYCNRAISIQYPVVEVLSALLFAISYVYWPHGFNNFGFIPFLVWLSIATILLALFVYDLKWMLLPNVLTYPLFILASVYTLTLALTEKNIGIIPNALLGLISIGGLFYLLFTISNGKWIGGGDVKLGVSLGLLAGGYLQGFLLIFFASLIGTVISIPELLQGKSGLKKRMPFGPLLILAFVIVFLYGLDIITWYERTVLYV